MNARNALASVLTKSGSFQNSGRVKLARHLLNIVQLQKELNVYNYGGLTKAAAANQNKSERIKFAALLAQHAIEKQAVLGALLRGAGLAARAIPKLGLNSIGQTLANVGGLASRAIPKLGLNSIGRTAANAGKAVDPYIPAVAGGAILGHLASQSDTNLPQGTTTGTGVSGLIERVSPPAQQTIPILEFAKRNNFNLGQGAIDLITRAGLSGQAMRDRYMERPGFTQSGQAMRE
jgi:hypothetical protein